MVISTSNTRKPLIMNTPISSGLYNADIIGYILLIIFFYIVFYTYAPLSLLVAEGVGMV
ncbi:MAG: hypothetical protein BACD_03704 [Bacteroides rodentium]